MSYNSSVYNEDYYKSYSGGGYSRGKGWEEIFSKKAARIVKELAPKTALDVGCAYGYLVEGLRDLGVDASGIDVSAYAISNVREDIRPFCTVKSATEEIKGKYDLITCIEVIEHLTPEDFDAAISNMCSAADAVIFSSSPFEYNEETHYSVNPPEFWAEKFAYNGFYHDISYDCSYISVQAMLFRKAKKNNIDLVRSYESKLFELWQENCTLRDSVIIANERIGILDKGNIAHAQEVYDLNAEIEKKSREIEELTKQLVGKEDGYIKYLQKKDMDYLEQLRQKDEELRASAEKLENDITQKYKSQMEEQHNSLKKKYSDLLRLEYVKRDAAEEKLSAARNRNNFLESELWKVKCDLENKLTMINSLNNISSELESCRNELLIYKAFAENDAVKTYISLRGRINHIFKRFFTSGRTYWAPVFNTEDYLRYNPDVREKIPHTRMRLLWHFIRHGMKEGRRASENFDVHAYRRYNPDVAAISRKDLRNAYYHYIEYGSKEPRRIL